MSRLWAFTNFKLDFDYQNYYKTTSAEYILYGLEVCPRTGKQHHQGFVYFKNARKSKKGVAKQLGQCHVEQCKGNIDQNYDYCTKDDTVTEIGNKPTQGKRTDLNCMKDTIMNGEKTVDDICVENPSAYHQYGRTLNKIEDIALRKKYRKWMTLCDWIWGPTGVGKSHVAMQEYYANPNQCYIYPKDGGWWDGYKGQETVIINEFRGGIAYGELLELIDKWPKTVRRRNREPVPFLAKKIIITSALPPEEIYHNLSENDSLDQLYRRIKVKHMTQKWSEGNTELQTTSDTEVQKNTRCFCPIERNGGVLGEWCYME